MTDKSGPACELCNGTGKVDRPITMETRGARADARRARLAKEQGQIDCPLCGGTGKAGGHDDD